MGLPSLAILPLRSAKGLCFAARDPDIGKPTFARLVVARGNECVGQSNSSAHHGEPFPNALPQLDHLSGTEYTREAACPRLPGAYILPRNNALSFAALLMGLPVRPASGTCSRIQTGVSMDSQLYHVGDGLLFSMFGMRF
jgi:hypothetical protein